MNKARIQGQYARHPQESLDRLADRLAKKKWSMDDVAREDAAHAEEFAETGEDKEFLDRYIIARIAERHDRRARVKQGLLRAAWEMRHRGESFDDALPGRMARFRQYEDVPFGIYGNEKELRKFLEGSGNNADSWKRYLEGGV